MAGVVKVKVWVGVEFKLDNKSGSDPASLREGHEALNLLAS